MFKVEATKIERKESIVDIKTGSQMLYEKKKEFEEIKLAEIEKLAKTFIVGRNLNEEETTQFIEICKAFGLNPFKRGIHLVKFGQQCNSRSS